MRAAMTITNIVGTSDADECAAIAELLTIVQRGDAYSDDLLDRLPSARVEVHVQSAVGGNLAVVVIEDGVFRFQPLDAAQPGRMQ